jgi:hypothetical protein
MKIRLVPVLTTVIAVVVLSDLDGSAAISLQDRGPAAAADVQPRSKANSGSNARFCVLMTIIGGR